MVPAAARPAWVRAMLLGARRRSTATFSVWACSVAALAFGLAGWIGPWLYLRFVMADQPEPDLAAAIGQALMPDLRVAGAIAAAAMLALGFAYWRARRWMDRHQRWR